MLRVVEAGVCAGGEQRSADLIAIRGGGFWESCLLGHCVRWEGTESTEGATGVGRGLSKSFKELLSL